jgi:hypothetical protein
VHGSEKSRTGATFAASQQVDRSDGPIGTEGGREMLSKKLFSGMALAAAITAGSAALGTSPASAAASVAPCRVQYGSAGLLYVFNGALDSCARTIRAAGPGSAVSYGTWGGYAVAVDSQSRVFLSNGGPWTSVGVAVNASGTVGSLSDRCMRGDIAACNQWRSQLQSSIDAMARLYPAGWGR